MKFRGGCTAVLALAALAAFWFGWSNCPCVTSDDGVLHVSSLPRECVAVRTPGHWIDPNGNTAEAGLAPPYYELRKAENGEYLAKLGSERRYFPSSPPTEYSRNTFTLRLGKRGDGGLAVSDVHPVTEAEWDKAVYTAPQERPYEDFPHVENGNVTIQGRRYQPAKSTTAWSLDDMISFDGRLFSLASISGPTTPGAGIVSFAFHPWRHAVVIDFFQLGDTRPFARIDGWACWSGKGHTQYRNWQVDNIWMMPLRGDHRDLLVCKF